MAKAKGKSKGIQPPVIAADERRLRFSFQYLQPDHLRFPLSDCSKDYFEALFREIIRYQAFTVGAFKEISPEEHRHPLTFSDTHETQGFPNIDPSADDLWTDDPWQFGLPSGKKGDPSRLWRVHGFIDSSVFYVVWLDPKHKLDC